MKRLADLHLSFALSNSVRPLGSRSQLCRRRRRRDRACRHLQPSERFRRSAAGLNGRRRQRYSYPPRGGALWRVAVRDCSRAVPIHAMEQGQRGGAQRFPAPMTPPRPPTSRRRRWLRECSTANVTRRAGEGPPHARGETACNVPPRKRLMTRDVIWQCHPPRNISRRSASFM